jgi:hypothetical protein
MWRDHFIGVLCGVLVGYSFKLADISRHESVKYFCIMCSAVEIRELQKILDERPEA